MVWQRLSKWLAVGTIGLISVKTVAFPIIFQGISMQPTIHPFDVGVCDRRIPFEDIRRGDIVIMKSSRAPTLLICKRVIGLEGDLICDSKPVRRKDSGYFDMLTFGTKSVYIPKGHVWVEGDNKGQSMDSRSYGPLPMGLVQARVVCKVFPLKDATIFPRQLLD